MCRCVIFHFILFFFLVIASYASLFLDTVFFLVKVFGHSYASLDSYIYYDPQIMGSIQDFGPKTFLDLRSHLFLSFRSKYLIYQIWISMGLEGIFAPVIVTHRPRQKLKKTNMHNIAHWWPKKNNSAFFKIKKKTLLSWQYWHQYSCSRTNY